MLSVKTISPLSALPRTPSITTGPNTLILLLCSREGSGHHYRATLLSNEGHDSRHTDKSTNV